jgi:putative FmdB family regulatory protein
VPTYEYRCKSCGEELEAVQSFTDDPLTECPACGGPLRKVFGSIGITFKGSGFYKTDSRAGSKSTSSTSSDGAGKDSSSSSESSSTDSSKKKEAASSDSSSSSSRSTASSSSGSTSGSTSAA